MQTTRQIRAAIGQIVPGFEQIAAIDETKQEFHIAGRTLHEPRFGTPTGRAQLHVHALPPAAPNEGQLRLMTVRSEGQFNTVVYEDYDLYRGQDRRDVILLHPSDLRRLGLTDGQRVAVRSATGVLDPVLVRDFPDIKPGNALMYYPEANVLVPRDCDPLSRTPAFKGIAVWVEPSAAGAVQTGGTIPAIEASTAPHRPLKAC
jgi:anaerobic selenocysteine-containing dehydrogenase